LLGDKIKELRLKAGLSQVELANKARIDSSYLSRLESKRVKSPSYTIVLRLARALSSAPNELLERDTTVTQAESPEEILDRYRIAMPASVPLYEDYPFHAGKPVEAADYLPIVRDRAAKRNLEGYIVRGKCLEPDVKDGDVVIVDRTGQIDVGNTVACLFNDELHIGRLRKIDEELYLENNHGRMKLEECKVAAPVIEVRRKLR